jgi:soluble lytic murein transglycosylase-like protein/predicted Zn-dependent peptidase
VSPGLRRALAATSLVLAGAGLAGVAGSASLRASLSAAWQAFRDPSRLAERAEPPLCPTPAGPTERAAPRCAAGDPLTDAEIARELAHDGGEDADDPDGPAIQSLAMPDLRVPITRRTVRYVRFFTRSERGRTQFRDRYRRAGTYLPIVEHALREAGLPEDLAWVAAIESGYDPRAVSSAGASGVWQLLPGTARQYGLEVSPWVDQRRSVAHATTAAVTLLRDLYERFGRWDLALAAYNLGHDALLRAMDRAAKKRGVRAGPVDLADLVEAGAVPEETANYVPKVVAFALVAANRGRYHFDGPEDAPGRPLSPAELAVPASTRLSTLARAAGVPVAVIREYNPELLRDRTPPTGGDTVVSVPAEHLAHALASFPLLHAADQRADEARAAEDEAQTGIPAPAPDAEGVALLDDERLPPRPASLGDNRLPDFSPPRRAIAPVAGFGLVDARLPMPIVGGGVGWRSLWLAPDGGDVLGAWGSAPSAREAGRSIERTLAAALRAPGTVASGILADDGGGERFTLPNGLRVVLRRDPRAVDVAVALRLDRPSLGATGATGEVAEAHTVLTVAPSDLDVGVQVAAARARMLLAEGGGAYQADLRRRASEPARRALAARPYGAAWLALSNALFPAGHPLEGTVVGTTDDEPAVLRDALLLEALRAERTPRLVTVTLAGAVDVPRARALAASHLGWLLAPADAPVAPPAPGQRIVVEEHVLTPAALLGWLAPPEGDPEHAALRVALDALCRGPSSRLARALVGGAHVARSVRCTLDPGPRAGVVAMEVVASPAIEAAALERELRAALDDVRQKGLGGTELAIAKALLRQRLERRLAERAAGPRRGAPPEVSTARLRAVLAPGSAERLLADVERVDAERADKAVARLLDPARAVVVTTVRKLPSGTANAEASAATTDVARASGGVDDAAPGRRIPLGIVSGGR